MAVLAPMPRARVRRVRQVKVGEEFERILRAQDGAGGRTTVPKHKGTRIMR
jgi:hypothetical protein